MRVKRKIKGVLVASVNRNGFLTLKEKGGAKPPLVQKSINRTNCK